MLLPSVTLLFPIELIFVSIRPNINRAAVGLLSSLELHELLQGIAQALQDIRCSRCSGRSPLLARCATAAATSRRFFFLVALGLLRVS